MPVLVAIVGGALILCGELVEAVPTSVSTLGVILFAVGVVWVFALGIRRSRREEVGVARATWVSAKESVRFAFDLFP